MSKPQLQRRETTRRAVLTAACMAGASGLVLDYGTYAAGQAAAMLAALRATAVLGFLLEAAMAASPGQSWRAWLRSRWPLLALTLLLLAELLAARAVGPGGLRHLLSALGAGEHITAPTLALQLFILGNLIINVPRVVQHATALRARPVVLLLAAFAALIACGTGLLMLPRAAPRESPVPLVDVLLTSTSAVCVTGLVVRETGAEFTRLGQWVIMLLIQAGGLGIMSLSAVLAPFLGQGLGLRESSVLREVFQLDLRAQVERVTRFIVLFTLVSEAAGTAILYIGFREAIPERWPTNWELGAYRATAVVRYLTNELKLEAARFAAVSYGPFRPLDTNATPEGRARNRFVQIVLHKPQR